jgi:hypothetical protein
MDRTYHIEGGNFSEAGFASSDVKKLLKKLGLPTNIIKKAAIAMYEAEINVVAQDRYLSLFRMKAPVFQTLNLHLQKVFLQLPAKSGKWVLVQEWDFQI